MSSDPRLEVFLSDSGEVFSGVQQGQYLWQPDPFDVETLNAPARRAFKRLLDRATASPPPDTGKILLLLGESGCGKTHLVRAFRNHAHGQQRGFTGYMPMTVDATHYDRYLLSNLIDSLDHPYDVSQGDDSGLMHLSNLLMSQCTSLFAPLIEHEQKILEDDELHGTVRAVADELLSDPRFHNVEVDLLRALIYFQRRDPRINRRLFNWLRCEDVSPEDRKVIGELVPRTSDDSAARMVEHLGRLMGALNHALVLCVDQVEDISDFEHRPQMESSFRRAMNTLAAIAGKVPRAVVVVCCLSDYWEKMRPLLTQAMVDRIENDPEPVTLERTVTANTARDMAARRLRSLYEQRGAAHIADEPTYPIPIKGFEALGGQRARDVLNECRRYRERAIDQQRLPETFPLPQPTRSRGGGTMTGDGRLNLEQAWTDFRAAYKEKLPEDASDITALLAWAVEISSEELGGSPRFVVKPRNGNDLVDIGEHPSGNKFVLALCDRSPRGGGLGHQMTAALKAAAGSTPILIRTSEFPSSTGTIVADQLGKLIRQGGRRVVLGDSELRDLVAMRDFRAQHVGQAAFAEWSRTARPITRLKSMGDILGLERLGLPSTASPSNPKPPQDSTPPRSVETHARVAPAGPEKNHVPPVQTRMFNDSVTTPFGKALPVEPRPPSAPTPVPLRITRTDNPVPRVGLANSDADIDSLHIMPAGRLLPEQEPRIAAPSTVPGLARKNRITPASGTPIPSEVLTGALKLGSSEGLLAQTITLEPTDLTRHSAFLGGTGSGKTTLALNILEQLLLRGIPVILVDRKGDLATYARAESWNEPLEDAALRERRRLLRERVDVALYTPGRSDGRPLAIPVVPHGLESLPTEEREQSVQQAADAIAGMLDYRTSPNDRAAKAVLAQALRLLMNQSLGKEVTLELLQQFVTAQDPALLEATDGIPTKTFSKLAQDLSVLRINLRTLLSAGGERLDLDELLGRGAHGVPGRTRLSIISTKFLGDNSRILFWVSQLLLETLRWASQHPSSKLQAVLLFDEADMYLPATSKPATKEPMESLLRRARSAGVGVMLATQSPGDFDYKCRENVQAWFVGKITQENALKRVRPLFVDARVDADARLPGQKTGQFHVLNDGRVQQLKADRSVIKTTQLSEDQILELARLSRKQPGPDTP
ncbi:helicase HerA-like domain-containing protein [Myxococcus stipitatus]|uniref:helicase HerA-like domain-containing protein n=1 Tax=Myxococcus stipitatus TaxID=83455 RepID=UPI0030CF1B69